MRYRFKGACPDPQPHSPSFFSNILRLKMGCQARPGQAKPGRAGPGQARPGQARQGLVLYIQNRAGPGRDQARPGQDLYIRHFSDLYMYVRFSIMVFFH